MGCLWLWHLMLAECRFRLKFKHLVDSWNVSSTYVRLIVLPAWTGQVKGAERKRGRTQKVSRNLVEIGWGTSSSSHDTRSTRQCGASPDALKMHSQSCCEVHLDSAESKSINVRAGQERTLVQLTAEQKIQENFIPPYPYPWELMYFGLCLCIDSGLLLE